MLLLLCFYHHPTHAMLIALLLCCCCVDEGKNIVVKKMQTGDKETRLVGTQPDKVETHIIKKRAIIEIIYPVQT